MTESKTSTLIEEADRLAKEIHLDRHDYEVYLLPALRRVKQIGFLEGKNDPPF